jgi:hypothetical protein
LGGYLARVVGRLSCRNVLKYVSPPQTSPRSQSACQAGRAMSGMDVMKDLVEMLEAFEASQGRAA